MATLHSPLKKRITKTRDSRGELHSSIELIVRAIIAERGLSTKKLLDSAIAKISADFKTLETKMQSLELTTSVMKSSSEDTQKEILGRIASLEKSIIENHDVNKKWITQVNKLIRRQKEEIEILYKKSSDDLGRIQQEVSAMRALTDEIKRSELDMRLQSLEDSVDMGPFSGDVTSFQGQAQHPKRSTGSRQHLSRPKSVPPAASTISNAMQAAFGKINAHEEELDALREKVEALSNHGASENKDSSLKSFKNKLRLIAESTSTACKTVSTSVSDIQEATIQLYSWADKVHSAIGMLAEKVAVNTNPCPRLHLLAQHSYTGNPETFCFSPRNSIVPDSRSNRDNHYRSRNEPYIEHSRDRLYTNREYSARMSSPRSKGSW